MRRNRRMTYRPSKSQAVFGGVVGILFVLIGLFVAIPTFGPFGILWTLIAVGITGMNFYQALARAMWAPRSASKRTGRRSRPAPPLPPRPGWNSCARSMTSV